MEAEAGVEPRSCILPQAQAVTCARQASAMSRGTCAGWRSAAPRATRVPREGEIVMGGADGRSGRRALPITPGWWWLLEGGPAGGVSSALVPGPSSVCPKLPIPDSPASGGFLRVGPPEACPARWSPARARSGPSCPSPPRLLPNAPSDPGHGRSRYADPHVTRAGTDVGYSPEPGTLRGARMQRGSGSGMDVGCSPEPGTLRAPDIAVGRRAGGAGMDPRRASPGRAVRRHRPGRSRASRRA